MPTNARHRRPSPSRWFPVIVSALLGTALGAAGVSIANPGPPDAQVTPQQTASSPAPPAPVTVETETERTVIPVVFSPPVTNAAGMSVTVLRPEKIKGGVRFTISLVNTNDRTPITVDTGAVGPHDPLFNGETVPMSMTPRRIKLTPGEGYTYQCSIKLPTMDMGRLEFDVGPVAVSGMAAGD